MIDLNPFVICNIDVQATIRQYQEREVWELKCQHLRLPDAINRAKRL